MILLHIYVFGDSVIGSIDFQEFFHSFIKSGIINAGVILVIIAFITTLIFGRFFCGWGCHFGAIQELSWWILTKFNITPKTINSRLIFILPLFMLIYFYITPNLYYAIINPWNEPQVKLAYPSIWAFLPGFFIGAITFFIDGFLIVYFLGRKGFCRFICPWGAFLKIPNTFAMYKVRKTGDCINKNVCTTSCPIGIDVNYEINNYGKVTNTNCTSCMICITDCPNNALSYKFLNPLKENLQLSEYLYKPDSYNQLKIKDLFLSIRKHDVWILLLTLILGFSIDGLYGMGHFLSFGISLIFTIIILNLYTNSINKNLKYIYTILIIGIFGWHGLIKYSIWQGVYNYQNDNYTKAIKQLELVTKIYPNKMSRFHAMLGELYYNEGKINKAKEHTLKAMKINPKHNAPQKLYQLIENSIK